MNFTLFEVLCLYLLLLQFANAFIHCRIDYCKSLINSLLKYFLHRLCKTQNSYSYNCYTYLLPVKYRINFKLCCIAYRALSLGEPQNLNSLLFPKLTIHYLRSSSFNSAMLSFFDKMSNDFRS